MLPLLSEGTKMTYLKCEDYLPHRPPMVLLDNVEEIGDDYAVCSCIVSPDAALGPFITDKGVPSYIVLELFSQTVGVWSGYQSLLRNIAIPPLGMVLGGRDFYCRDNYFSLNSTLTVKVTKIMDDNRLACFEGQVLLRDEVIAGGRVNVMRVSEQELDRLFKRN